jgi:hypothetical protein
MPRSAITTAQTAVSPPPPRPKAAKDRFAQLVERKAAGALNGYSGPLNERQLAVARAVAEGKSWRVALESAGMRAHPDTLHKFQADPRIQAVIQREAKRSAEVVNMTRKKVMDGFLDAIEMARTMADPNSMIKGWSEVARMCGYYAAETKKIEVSFSAKRLIDKFETMSDEELLRHAEAETTIDVDAIEVDDDGQKRLENQPNDQNTGHEGEIDGFEGSVTP